MEQLRVIALDRAVDARHADEDFAITVKRAEAFFAFLTSTEESR